MAKIVQLHTSVQEEEARLVAGMEDEQRSTQYELYEYCADYYWENYKGVFFADHITADEILQSSFIALWENIERHKIYAHGGRVMGKNNEPLKGSILTYFMGIAWNKYKEWGREHPSFADPEEERAKNVRKNGLDHLEYMNMQYGSNENDMLDIIAEVISNMSPRCYEILTKFYYEQKSLDVILGEILSIGSKDALKTKKYKCMETLRKTAEDMHRRYLNE